jgi:hydroxymethylglutaryl-CoA reductase (NADPH)
MSLRDCKTIKERRLFLTREKKTEFRAIEIYPEDLNIAGERNCENMIGATSVPLGATGPLLLNGTAARGKYYIPLATTEGALVASVNRGCKAITLAGGAKVYCQNAGITRGPVFATKGLGESMALKDWIENNYSALQIIAEKSSSHLTFKQPFIKIIGRNVFVRFSFDSQDAMGMNMVTIATTYIAREIEEKTGARLVSLAGNFDTDKKPSWINFILGRGRQVWAEAELSRQIIAEVLKTTAEKMHEVAIKKCLLGSAVSGAAGYNCHFANVIAAMFIACGQDAAHTVEGSMGITTTEIVNGNLAVSVYMPDLPVGTVGGGTGLPCQAEALSLLGVKGGDRGKNASKLTEIIAGAVLAGEISLLASLAEGSLAAAHRKLARPQK